MRTPRTANVFRATLSNYMHLWLTAGTASGLKICVYRYVFQATVVTTISFVALTKVLPSFHRLFTLHFSPTYLLRWLLVKFERWLVVIWAPY
jgi:hypothetical protein